MKAFIPAAGLGTRLLPLTENKPKALVELLNKTLLQITISRLINVGIKEIIINVHHFSDQIIEYLRINNNFGIDIKISDESAKLLDTGGGLKKTSWFFNGVQKFIIHNVDVLTDFSLSKIIASHNANEQFATLAVQKRKSTRYFLFDEEKNLCGWENTLTNDVKITRNAIGNLTKLAFSGIQVVNTEIFSLMPPEDKFSIIDLYLSIASNHRITYFDHTDSIFLDIGKKENLIEAEKILTKII